MVYVRLHAEKPVSLVLARYGFHFIFKMIYLDISVSGEWAWWVYVSPGEPAVNKWLHSFSTAFNSYSSVGQKPGPQINPN